MADNTFKIDLPLTGLGREQLEFWEARVGSKDMGYIEVSRKEGWVRFSGQADVERLAQELQMYLKRFHPGREQKISFYFESTKPSCHGACVVSPKYIEWHQLLDWVNGIMGRHF